MESLEHYYDAVLSLFVTDGWQEFIEDCRRFSSEADNIRQVKDAEDLYYRQGQLNIIDFVLGYENTIRNAKDEWDRQQASPDAEEGEE
jgi:hypothetical protein